MNNRLYYGDNLEILRSREYFPDECVDLIYLDPPFNSNRNYNVLFKSESGADSEAQITAFEDTWHWGETAEETYRELVTDGPEKVSTAIEALLHLIDRNQMMAYLVMMTARLVELRRVLKSTGSLYLHCDPTASHYLKIVLDAIFGGQNYRNEIVWKRTSAHSDAKKWARVNDTVLYYVKDAVATWNTQYAPYDDDYIDSHYTKDDEDGRGRYRLDNMAAPEGGGMAAILPETGRPRGWYFWKGYHPPARGWRYSPDTMRKLDEDGRIWYPDSKEKRLALKRYLEEMPGRVLDTNWSDISPIGSHAKERLGYPTQKPVALLERIIRASSNEGDVVLDPFCGCGTAIAAAHKLGRRWIGIDITHLSIALQKYRLQDMFELVSGQGYEVIGEPQTEDGARELAQDSANEGRFQFEWWALSLVGAKPVGGQAGSRKGKKGSDKGIDGVINFFEQDDKGKSRARKIIVQVKSGKVRSGDIRDLKGVLEREKAAIGVFISLELPTQEMLKEALAAGTYESQFWDKQYRKLQILSIRDLLGGDGVDMPPQHGTHRQAERYRQTDLSREGKSQKDLM